MKRILVAASAVFILATAACKSDKNARADEKNVIPSNEVTTPVQNAFTAKYTGATEVIWEDAHENGTATYKVKFKRDGKYWKAEFKPDGSLLKEKEDD